MRNLLNTNLSFHVCVGVFVSYMWLSYYTWKHVMLQISQSKILLI